MRHSMLPRLALISSLCVVLLCLQSCGSGDDDSGSGGAAGFDVELTLRATNSEQRSSFPFGSSIVFELKIANRSGGSQVLSMPTSQLFDFAVMPEGSPSPRWRWSFNRAFTPGTMDQNFGPNQSITHVFIWNGVLEDGTQIMPGTYEVRGTLAYAQYSNDWRANHELAAPLRKLTITN